jgi:hypothetical protein
MAVTCGPACAGAFAGGAANLTTQFLSGQSFSATSFVVDTGLGAIGGKVVGAILPPIAKSQLSNQTKGAIGEGLTELGLVASGQSIVGRNVANGVGRSNFDFQLATGAFVESKFGTATLSSAQKAASQLVDVTVQSWTYPTVSGIVASGPVAALDLGSTVSNFLYPSSSMSSASYLPSINYSPYIK